MPDRVLSDIRRYPNVVNGHKYGIEVEIEHVQPGGIFIPGWDTTEDHSLRGRSAELISPPQAVNSLHEKLQSVYELRRAGGWAPSIRCGIHIHANVRWARASQLRRILQQYVQYEPMLFLMMGPEREQSNFCVPWYRSQSTVDGVAMTLYRWEHHDTLDMDKRLAKYSALNILPLMSQGTIEFRHAPTFDVEDKAHQWLDIVAAIVEGREPPVDDQLSDAWRQRRLLLDTDAIAQSLVRTREKVPAEAWGVPASMRLAPLNFPAEKRAKAKPVRAIERLRLAINDAEQLDYNPEVPEDEPNWGVIDDPTANIEWDAVVARARLEAEQMEEAARAFAEALVNNPQGGRR